MGWTLKGQKPGTYRPSATPKTKRRLSPVVERNLWKIIRNAMKSKALYAKRKGRFLIFN